MLLKSCYQLRARNLTKKLTDQFHRDIIGRGGWNNNNLGRGTSVPVEREVLTGWLAGWLPACTTEMRRLWARERGGKEERERERGRSKDGMAETRAEAGIQFHCDERMNKM